MNSLIVTKMDANMDRGAPVSMGKWAKWDVANQKSLLRILIGCSVSQSAKYNYSGHFKQWGNYRSVNGLVPYLGLGDADSEREDDFLLAYLALPVGPSTRTCLL